MVKLHSKFIYIFILASFLLFSCNKSFVDNQVIDESSNYEPSLRENGTDTFWNHFIDPTQKFEVNSSSQNKKYIVNKMAWEEVYEIENTPISDRYLIGQELNPMPDQSTATKSTMLQILPDGGSYGSNQIVTSFLEDSNLVNENFSGYLISSTNSFELIKAFEYKNGNSVSDTTVGHRLEFWDTPTSPIQSNTAQPRNKTFCEYVVFIVYDLNTGEILNATVLYEVCYGIGGSAGDHEGGGGNGRGNEPTPNKGPYGDCSSYRHAIGSISDTKTFLEMGYDLFDVRNNAVRLSVELLDDYKRIINIYGFAHYDGNCDWNLSYHAESQSDINESCVDLQNPGGASAYLGNNRVELNYKVSALKNSNCGNTNFTIGISVGLDVSFDAIFSTSTNYLIQSRKEVSFSGGTNCDNDCNN